MKDQILRRSSRGSWGKRMKVFGWEGPMVVLNSFKQPDSKKTQYLN
jgi:hypothetical protein